MGKFAAVVAALVAAALVFRVPAGLVVGTGLGAAAYCFWRGR